METIEEKLIKNLKVNGITDKTKLENVLSGLIELISVRTDGYYRILLPRLFSQVKDAYERVEAKKAERTILAGRLRSEYRVLCNSYKLCTDCPYNNKEYDCYSLFCYDKGTKKEK